ncbi:MAG: rhodanese-like domain-containing protein [Calditrichaeota bacterium]|nr:MAG: rhodanese-like domain-containing protein [Calditrichota bacterium]MBL1207638.1 rhodanese-like domain-containing protein [Calditrichota bacterium]NOG47471.1 rhodanese-like domain-containing protein [Calditrichota bacterium]
MRKNTFLFILIPIFSFSLFWGCSESSTDSDPVDEYAVLLEYLEGDAGDFINTTYTALKSAADVKTDLGTDQYLIDIRSAGVYDTLGHIPGAVNVAFSDLITHVEGLTTNPSEIIIICYSGQTAAYGTSLLQLLGHDNVYSMKFGMTSWNSKFDSWTNNCSNGRYVDFVKTDTPKGPVVDSPVLSTDEEEGPAILRKRVEEVLAAGFSAGAITNAAVFADLDGHYINNYWPNDQYLDPGHIPGAINYIPRNDLKSENYLNTLPADKPVVTYCYTGQGSAFLTAYLRVLGYDAYSLKFGANGMIHDYMPASKFTSAAIMEYTEIEYTE